MRKGRFGSLIVLVCGVVLASGAFAAEQPQDDVKALLDRFSARLDKLEAENGAAEPVTQEPAAEKTSTGFLGSVFTKFAPKFGGDANIEYDTRDSNQGDGLTGRVRLTMDVDIDPRMYLHTRLTAKNYVNGHEFGQDRQSQAAGYENEAVKVGMEQMYLGVRLGPRFNDGELRIGRQPLWLATGMLADINGINGVSLKSSVFGVNAFGFYGRNGTHDTLQQQKNASDTYYSVVDLSKNFGPLELGATFMKVDDNFYALKANYQTPFNTLLFSQYVKNDDAADDDQGYMVGAKYGNAGKKGTWDALLSYVHIEDSINPNGSFLVNDGNWVGAKGIRTRMHYAVTDWSTLGLVQDFFDTINGGEKHNRTTVEFEVRF